MLKVYQIYMSISILITKFAHQVKPRIACFQRTSKNGTPYSGGLSSL